MLAVGAGAPQTTTATLAAIDPTTAILFMSVRGSSTDPGDGQIRGQLGATSLTFNRGDDTSLTPMTVQWYVAEFSLGVTVQRGTASVTNSGTISINAVTLAQSFVLLSCSSPGTSVGYAVDDFFRGQLLSPTSLEIVHNSTLAATCDWQVVDYTGAAVQRGSGALAIGAGLATPSIAVDLSRSFAQVTWRSSGGTSSGENAVEATLNATNLVIRRELTTTALDYAWEVVTFSDGTRVSGAEKTFTGLEVTGTDTLTFSANLGQSVALLSAYQRTGAHAFTGDDNPGPGWFTVELTSPTAVTLTRGITGSVAARAGYFVIEFQKLAVGQACGVATDCDSTFCVDAVCCNAACGGTDPTDCQACSLAAGAALDGTCAMRTAGAICRGAAGDCDAAEDCSGSSPSCPADLFQNGTSCRSSAGPCDTAELCSGTQATCPSDAFAPPGTVCRPAAGGCDLAEVCEGTVGSCPTDALVPAATPASSCAPFVCSGAQVSCPASCQTSADCTPGRACRTGACAIPPRFPSRDPIALSASCGVPFEGTPGANVLGDAPFTFELRTPSGAALPAGLELDAQTSTLRWTPSNGQEGTHSLVLIASVPGATDALALELDVACAPVHRALGCGCATGDGLALTLLPAFLWTVLRRRHRPMRFGPNKQQCGKGLNAAKRKMR